MSNKIVVKFKDGEIVKGWSTDFGPNKEIFHLHPLEEYHKDILKIKISSLKAVFFVKDYNGNKDYKNSTAKTSKYTYTKTHNLSVIIPAPSSVNPLESRNQYLSNFLPPN